ncbi:MAG: hypothetical protein V3T84_06330 [Phycisphaerales bacterium]
MGCRVPGPLCISRSNSVTPDKQTLVRARSLPPGPTGRAAGRSQPDESHNEFWGDVKEELNEFLEGVKEEANEFWEGVKEWTVEEPLAIWTLAKLFDQWGEISHEWFWRFLAHYLTGDGEEFKEFKTVPFEWQNAIRKNWRTSQVFAVQNKYPTRYPKGKKFRIKPYDWKGLDDLTRSLGHFDLTYSKKDKKETYVIEDRYEFNYYDEMNGSLSEHGGKNVKLPKWLSEQLLRLMPRNEYKVPEGTDKGKVQKFTMKQKDEDTWDIILPTGWLQENGKPFQFRAEFSSTFHIEDYIGTFDESGFFAGLDEDDLAHDLMFLRNSNSVRKVFESLQKNHASEGKEVAEHYILGLAARQSSPKLSDLKGKTNLVDLLKSVLKDSPVVQKLSQL